MPEAALAWRSTRARAASSARVEAWALVALTALALWLRTTSLSRGLFTDELYSVALAQRGFGHMLVLFGYEANGTLYSIVLWPLLRLFGDGEQLVRLPSVIAGAASVPTMWWAARELAGRSGVGARAVAWLAAVLLAVNPMAVWYSQEARAYAFVVLAACVAFGSLARALRRPDARGAWVAYVLAMAAMAYCDLLAAPLALPAQLLLVGSRGRRARGRWLRALCALLVCCLPLLVAAGISRSRRDALYWLPKTDRSLVELAVQEFAAGFAKVNAIGWASLLVGAVLVACAAWRLRRADADADGDADPDRGAARLRLAVAATWGLLPAALLLAVSFVEPVFWPRYAIVSLPGLCLLVALAAERTFARGRSRALAGALAGACVAALVALALFADSRQVGEIQEQWAPVAAWLRAERQPGQPTIVDNALVLPSLGYYDPAFRAPDGELVVQEWGDEPLPAGFVGYKDRTGYGSVPDGPPGAARIAALARRGGGTVWMIVAEVDDQLQGDPRDGAAVSWARRHCHVEVRESVGVWALRATRCR